MVIVQGDVVHKQSAHYRADPLILEFLNHALAYRLLQREFPVFCRPHEIVAGNRHLRATQVTASKIHWQVWMREFQTRDATMVMDVIPNAVTLFELAQRLSEDRWAEVLVPFIQFLTELLQQWHARGILHGDLGSTNIVIDTFGNDYERQDPQTWKWERNMPGRLYIIDLARMSFGTVWPDHDQLIANTTHSQFNQFSRTPEHDLRWLDELTQLIPYDDI